MAKQQHNGKQGKGTLGSVFGALSGALDDIVSEVKQDLKEMTPESAKPLSARQKLMQEANQRSQQMADPSMGLMMGDEPGQGPAPAAPAVANAGMPVGNLWHLLRQPGKQAQLRTDAVYQALTSADVESYAKALSSETQAPFTLGIIAANVNALTADEWQERPPPDLLIQTLLRAVQFEPRLFGAIGAGPRQLWASLPTLDDYLVTLLNANRKIIALGPLGLDEPFAPYTLSQQQAQLVLQLEIALDFNIPALVYTRKSVGPLAEALARVERLPPLVYLDPLQADEDVALVERFGMYALMRPELTTPNFTGNNYYKTIPAERLLLASGSALVAPHGFAGHFNQPKFLENSLQAAAKMRGQDAAALGAQASVNLVEMLQC